MAKPIKRKCPACGDTKLFRADQKTCGCAGSHPNLALRTPKTKAVIAFLDIETMPSIAFVWGKWEQDVLDFIQDGYMFSYAIKIAGKPGVKVRALDDYPAWKKDKTDETALLTELVEDLKGVDIVVAHNGQGFDIPTILTRMVTLGFDPLRPFQVVDTLKWARATFKFKSNKLDDLARDLKIGRKLPHTGFHLWKSCMDGDPDSCSLMKRYNKHDVELLEAVYYRLLNYVPSPVNINKQGGLVCPRCGGIRLKFDGERFTLFRKKNQIQCLDCLGWFWGPARKI
jgi:RNase_H superfamily